MKNNPYAMFASVRRQGFLAVVISICKGTGIFTRLVFYPVPLALFHFLLLAFICSLFIAVCRYFPMSRESVLICDILSETFGGMKIEENGIFPSMEPERERSVVVSENTKVSYFPSPEKLAVSDIDSGNCVRGVIWTPWLISMWLELKKGEFYVFPFVHPFEKFEYNSALVSKPEIRNLFEKNFDKGSTLSFISMIAPKGTTIAFGSLRRAAMLYITAGIFLVYIFRIIFSAVLFTSIFALIYSFLGKDSLSNLHIRNLFTVGIYAGFPAVIIASFFPALDLPFIDYQTVFLICFLVYLFAVFSRLQKFMAAMNGTNGNETD